MNNNTQFFPATNQGSFNPITGPEYSCPVGFLVETGSSAGKTGQCRISQRSALHSDNWNAESAARLAAPQALVHLRVPALLGPERG